MKRGLNRPFGATAVAGLLALVPAPGARSEPPPTTASPSASEAQPAAPKEEQVAERPWWKRVKISGLAFGDAYGVVEDHDPEVQGQYGFWIRRLYLTFDIAVAENWSARLRFEADSPGDFVESNAKLEPFVKDAYLAWKGKNVEVLMGISPSPTFDFIERFWGYRAAEKTPLDLYRMASSRDFGVAVKGEFAGGRGFYHAMVGNGAGEGAETNQGKKAMLACGFEPSDALVFELYADIESRPDSTDRTTWQGFLGFRGRTSRFGLQYAYQNRQADGGPDQPLAVGSIFGVLDLSSRASLFLRYDRSFEGNPEGEEIPYLEIANDTRFDFALAGFDWELARKIDLVPNVEYVNYRETDGQPVPGNDLIVRLTLYFQF